MGSFNNLRASLRCLRCGSTTEMVVNVYLGFKDLKDYRIGDRYEWVPRKTPPKGGRPEGGNAEGEGYVECPVCHKDFHASVIVRGDIIVDVRPDPGKKPLMPD